MKRIIICFSYPITLCLVCFGCILITANRTASIQYSNLKASEKKIEEICFERSLSEEELLQSISFNGYALSFEREKKRWYYSIVENCETSDDPMVSWTAADKATTILFEDRKLADADDIAGNVSITVIAYNDDYYERYELFCTTLPIVEIEVGDNPFTQEENVFVNDTDNEAYNYLSDAGLPIKYVDTNITFRLFDNRSECTDRVTVSEATAHIRGSSSVFWDKKSYKINLVKNEKKNKVSLLGMRTDDDWILYAGATDGERIRNVFSTNLWYETCAEDNPYGMTNGTQGKYVELFINGSYAGLYALMYPADSKQFGLEEGTTLSTSDYLYRQEDSVNDLRFFEVEDAFSFRGAAKEQDSEEQWAPLKEYQSLFFADSETFALQYEEMVYMNNAMDIWLFVHLTLGVDNLGKNINYIAKYDTQKEGYCMLFSPWDMDRTWGLGMDDPDYTAEGIASVEVYTFGISRKLVEDKDFQEQLVNRYTSLRKSVWTDTVILDMLETYAVQIWDSGAMNREMEVYGTVETGQNNSAVVYDPRLLSFRESVQKQLEAMDDFMYQQLDGYIAKLEHYFVLVESLFE